MKKGLVIIGVFILIFAGIISAEKFFGSAYHIGENQEEYEEKFAELFNQVTPEGSGKWKNYEPSNNNWHRLNFDPMMEFARENNLSVKEHTLIWEITDPTWLQGMNYTQIQEEIIDWMSELLTYYPDIEYVDVVNEPLHVTSFYIDAIGGEGETGWDWVVWCFERAREIAPDAKLLVNDYNILNGDKLNEFIELISVLNDRGLIDGIGVQAHNIEGETPSQIQSSLDSLSQFGLPIYISEFEVDIIDDATQETKYREIFPVMWDHPSVEGVTLWGFWEERIWRPNAYLVHTDGTERPALVWLKQFFVQSPQCNDGLDNDGDGEIDMEDVGCVSLIDHYETNCGDSVCESYMGETSLICEADCGVLTCGNCIIEAENMAIKSVGSYRSEGWGLWSNGYIAHNINFNHNNFTFEIIARGTDCGDGIFPTMEFNIGNNLIETFTVDSISWESYTLSTTLTPGVHEIRVTYTNDCYSPPSYDRNLYVDKIITSQLSLSNCGMADTLYDNLISITELISFIGDWKSGSVSINELITAIGEWKNGCS